MGFRVKDSGLIGYGVTAGLNSKYKALSPQATNPLRTAHLKP